ncbi:MAG: ferric reductase-like transmembrane domain-containing protein [Gammaproteobacteria bacterium]|nr:ferric reductase-like transmembrane domain-containing protein [Gammaproteobacteria bacterium]
MTLSLPLVWLGYAVSRELSNPGVVLGADPGEAVLHFFGDWTVRLLLLTLSVSTMRRLFRQPAIGRYRRMIGLFAFAYAVLHMLSYLGFLAEFEWRIVLEDFVDRTYITVGISALLLLLPLALTSTRGWQRRLGRRWRRLHKLVYPAMGLGLLHLLWLTKDGYAEPLLYCAIFAGLMVERLVDWRRRT